MAHVVVVRNPAAGRVRRFGVTIPRRYGQQGMPYLARFVTASAFPGLGTRAYGFLATG